MLVVTGGIACGKSTFLEAARELYGETIIDADEWYHKWFLGSTVQVMVQRALFGSMTVKAAAFVHPNWSTYEAAVAGAFSTYVNNVSPFICVIPEFFKYEDYWRAQLGEFKVLTIERDDHVGAAVARDSHRTIEQTQLIADNQTPSSTRVDLSDYVLYNVGSKDEFKQECVSWLKLHLPEVSTHRMKVIDM